MLSKRFLTADGWGSEEPDPTALSGENADDTRSINCTGDGSPATGTRGRGGRRRRSESTNYSGMRSTER